MNVAACLVFSSVVVAVLAPRLLVRMVHGNLAPRLGVAVWLVAIGSVVASWATAAVFVAAEVLRDWMSPGWSVLDACFAKLRAAAAGRDGLVVQLGFAVVVLVAAAVLAVLAWRLARSLLQARLTTREHARLARIAGRQVSGIDAVVLDAPQRAVYCVAGRPHTIIVTSAALAALEQPCLNAVLAHERAHLKGRHHLVLAATRAAAAVLPRMSLFSSGTSEIARLLEMCADDVAARSHGSRTVLKALLALSGTSPLPAGALGATGTGVLARAQRLAAPPAPVHRLLARALLGAMAVLVAAGPVATGVLAAAGIAMCFPMGA